VPGDGGLTEGRVDHRHHYPPYQPAADIKEVAVSSSLDAHPDLPPSTARVYRLLSLVFPDDIDAGLTAAVCGLPAGQAVQALGQLSTVHLLENLGRQRGRDTFAGADLFGKRHFAFEADARALLDAHAGEGLLVEDAVFTALLARRPGGAS
jgi:hypothetical protein